MKRWLYQRQGVGTYWIVDPDARVVEVWRPRDERPAIEAEWVRGAVADGGPSPEIAVAELFSGLPSSAPFRPAA